MEHQFFLFVSSETPVSLREPYLAAASVHGRPSKGKKISNYSDSTLNCFKFTESDIIGSITIALMSHYKDCNFQYVYLYRTNKEIKKYGFPDDYYNKNHLALSVFQILKNIFVTNPLLITNYSVVKDAIATFNGKDSDALLRKLIQEIPALSKLNDIAFDPEKINYINFKLYFTISSDKEQDLVICLSL